MGHWTVRLVKMKHWPVVVSNCYDSLHIYWWILTFTGCVPSCTSVSRIYALTYTCTYLDMKIKSHFFQNSKFLHCHWRSLFSKTIIKDLSLIGIFTGSTASFYLFLSCIFFVEHPNLYLYLCWLTFLANPFFTRFILARFNSLC